MRSSESQNPRYAGRSSIKRLYSRNLFQFQNISFFHKIFGRKISGNFSTHNPPLGSFLVPSVHRHPIIFIYRLYSYISVHQSHDLRSHTSAWRRRIVDPPLDELSNDKRYFRSKNRKCQRKPFVISFTCDFRRAYDDGDRRISFCSSFFTALHTSSKVLDKQLVLFCFCFTELQTERSLTNELARVTEQDVTPCSVVRCASGHLPSLVRNASYNWSAILDRTPWAKAYFWLFTGDVNEACRHHGQGLTVWGLVQDRGLTFEGTCQKVYGLDTIQWRI